MSTPKWKAKGTTRGWITEDGREFSYLRLNDNWSESTEFFLVRHLNVPKTDRYRWEIYPIPYKDIKVEGSRYFKYLPRRYVVTRTN
jgi:hypothetical protein